MAIYSRKEKNMKLQKVKELTQDHVGKVILVQGMLEWKKSNKANGETMIKSWVVDLDGSKIYLPTSFNSDEISKTISNVKQKQFVQVKGIVGKVKNSPKEGNFFESVENVDVFDTYEGEYVVIELLKAELNKRFRLIKNKALKKVVVNCIGSIKNFYEVPYDKDRFSYRGGLADYTLRLLDTIIALTTQSGRGYFLGESCEYDLDLLLTAGCIHRLGKANRYYFDENKQIVESDEGYLNDDNMATLKIYSRALEKVQLDPETENLLDHLISSSKGEYKWGAFAEPKTKEAYLLHFAEAVVLNKAVFDKFLQNGIKANMYDGGIVRGHYGKEYYLGNLEKDSFKEETTEENEKAVAE